MLKQCKAKNEKRKLNLYLVSREENRSQESESRIINNLEPLGGVIHQTPKTYRSNKSASTPNTIQKSFKF